MRYQGIGIVSIHSQQKPRKVFVSRFRATETPVYLTGALSLQKTVTTTVETVKEAKQPFKVLVAIRTVIQSVFNQRELSI